MNSDAVLILTDFQKRCHEYIDALDDMIDKLNQLRSKYDSIIDDAYDMQDEIDNSAMIISSILSKEVENE